MIRKGERSFDGSDVEVEGVIIPSRPEAKCLGYWWKGDLFATRAVDENIKKARHTFGPFKEFSTLLQATSVCYIPVLLYRCENWILSKSIIGKLNSFLQIKRSLRWPKHLSNTAAHVAFESIKSRLLMIKLRFLKRRISMLDENGIGSEMMRETCDDINLLCLVYNQ